MPFNSPAMAHPLVCRYKRFVSSPNRRCLGLQLITKIRVPASNWKIKKIRMGELFHHPSDDLVPEQQVFEVARYDECLYGAREIDERPRLFQRIAITMRQNVEQLLFFYDMHRRRIRELKREITCLCFQLDEANRKRRESVERTRTLEQENRELIEQVSGLATSLVQVSLERDCQGSNLRKWNVFGRLLALAVVFVAYICTLTFIQ